MTLGICVAGVTGWTGSEVARAVLAAPDLALTGAVARRAAGRDAGAALGGEPAGVVVQAALEDALEGADVLIDYTHPAVVGEHAQLALSRGVAVVIGTSGLGADDLAALDGLARDAGLGVVAAGNFSLTAALLKHLAGIAARHVPHWEVLDFAHAGKPDAPSGTARELAESLGDVATNELEHALDETLGERAARGATLGGAQVHSVRLPGHVLAVEAQFGLPDERLTLRHDAGASAAPYVGGTLLAARRAPELTGLVRGLDTLLFGAPA